MHANDGIYWAAIKGSGMAESATKPGAFYFFIDIKVTHIARDGNWEQLPQALDRTIIWSLSDKAYEYTERRLKSMQFNGDFENPGFGPDTANGIQVTCKNETYEGKPRERWDIPAEQGERKQASTDAIAKMKARWATNKAVNAAPPVGKPAAPAIPKPANHVPPPPISGDSTKADEDIPF